MMEMAGSGQGGGPTPTGEVYQGVVKSASQKFGFIESSDLQMAYGCDCFCLAHQLVGYSVGDQVQFSVGVNKDGKPQAIEIEPLGGGLAAKGYGKKGGGKGPGCMGGVGGGCGSFGGCGGGTPGMPMPRATGEMYFGTIKSISAKFGFIESAEIKANYGGDCFCLGRQLQNFNVGDQVQFEVGINEEGKPQAISVSGNGFTSVWNDGKGNSGGNAGGGCCGKGGGGCKGGGKCGGGKSMGKAMGKDCWGGGWGGPWDGPWGGAWDGGWGGGYWMEPSWGGPMMKGCGGGSFCTGGKGKAGGKPSYSSAAGVKRKPEETGEVFEGTVKSTSAKFGFIQCEEVSQKYGQDCFCLGEQLMNFQPGDAVQFTVGINQKGQPQAIEVGALGGAGPAAKAMRLS